MYPAALTCLIASKAYGVTKAAVVPRVLPPDMQLVKVNSRLSLTGTAAAAISAPFAGLTAILGAEWSLRYACLLFVVATVLAILLPSRVDSAAGEEQVGYSEIGTGGQRRKVGCPGWSSVRCGATPA